MSRIEQEPEVTDNERGGKRYRHPAYGQIILTKVQGGATLYGSDFRHRSYVSISVHESEFTRDLSRDWPHSRGELVRIAMSEAQWAAFVSSAGVGEGVQCTLERVMGASRPEIPYRDADSEHMAGARETLQDGLDAIAKARAALLASGLSKTKQEAILAPLNKAEMEFASNFDFVAASFAKAMETRVEKAKVEVNAYMTNAVMRAGIASLKSEPPLLLEGSTPASSPLDVGVA